MRVVAFTVPGIPRPQGSKRHIGRGIMVEQSKYVKDWRATVALAGAEAMGGDPLLDGPLTLVLTFLFPRPKSHYRTGKYAELLKPGAPSAHVGTPDLSKLVRAVEDALTGVVYTDDSRIAAIFAQKSYGPRGLVDVRVEPITEAGV